MKTSVLFLVAILLTVSPAFAAKNKPCPLDSKSTGKNHYVHNSSGKSEHRIRQKNKQFETPRNHVSKMKKNPNNTKGHYSTGGFYSFRRKNYSAHIFHWRKS